MTKAQAPANEEIYQKTSVMAQKFLGNQPVVVLGTGATIPLGLPSMPQLADELTSSIPPEQPGWDEFTQSLESSGDLEQALSNSDLPEETVDIIVTKTWELVSAKDLECYSRIQNGGVFDLADLFRYLLRIANPHLRVITTNYDRVAEYAANIVSAHVTTGMTTGWHQRFVSDLVARERPPEPGYEGQVSVLKVHGSLDWFLDSKGNIQGIPLAPEIPEDTKPLVVTPGTTKYRETHKDPFRTVLSEADRVIRNANCFLCIGYGFNDDHVQTVLENQVTKNDVPLVIVTRSLTKNTADSFLSNPPKQFLFLESDNNNGTNIYHHESPEGEQLKELELWQLDNFVKMITGEF